MISPTTLALGQVVAEHGDFEFPRTRFLAANALFDHQLAVVFGCEIEGRAKFLAVVRLADANRRAEVRRLHKQRIL